MDPVSLQKRCAVLLRPLAVLYRFLLKVRRLFWEGKLAKRLKPSCPCISVGNIAWGGTGKTPITDWILSWAESKNIKTVVLSRGYKADLSITPVYVRPHHSAREVGDEPLMLGLDHPDSAILVDPDRRRSGEYALRSLFPELLVLDDGFQHVAVKRDLDMVLLRPSDLREEWGRVIPAGSWREGISALQRAGVFLIKCDRMEMESLLPAFEEHLRVFQRPVFSFTLQPSGLERVLGPATTTMFGDRPYLLVTGVGNPDLVAETAERYLGRAPEKHFVYPDHYAYAFKDTAQFERFNLPIVCTRKDAVKLRRLPLPEVWALRVRVRFGLSLWSGQSFPQWLEEWWRLQQGEAMPMLGQEGWSGFSASSGLMLSAPLLSPAPRPVPRSAPEDVSAVPKAALEDVFEEKDSESAVPAESEAAFELIDDTIADDGEGTSLEVSDNDCGDTSIEVSDETSVDDEPPKDLILAALGQIMEPPVVGKTDER